MKDTIQKYKLKDYEFTDYKFKSKASRKVRRRIRKAAKRVKNSKLYILYF